MTEIKAGPISVALSTSSSSTTPPVQSNKICQWYCCECGQTYGSIIYTDEQQELRPYQRVDENCDTIDKVRHYSNMLYYGRSHSVSPESPEYTTQPRLLRLESLRDGVQPVQPVHTEQCAQSPPADQSAHFAPAPPAQSLEPSAGSTQGPSPRQLTLITDFQSPPQTPAQSPLSPSQVLLDPPSRFTCHRCDHMMCPYCLKIRVGDLK